MSLQEANFLVNLQQVRLVMLCNAVHPYLFHASQTLFNPYKHTSELCVCFIIPFPDSFAPIVYKEMLWLRMVSVLFISETIASGGRPFVPSKTGGSAGSHGHGNARNAAISSFAPKQKEPLKRLACPTSHNKAGAPRSQSVLC